MLQVLNCFFFWYKKWWIIFGCCYFIIHQVVTKLFQTAVTACEHLQIKYKGVYWNQKEMGEKRIVFQTQTMFLIYLHSALRELNGIFYLVKVCGGVSLIH